MTSDDHARALKLATNQSAFHSANERLEQIALLGRFDRQQRVPFVCECDDSGCRETVMLSINEYEDIRANATWFLLVAGHEDVDATCERVVDAERGYAIVEKVGVAGAEAARLDPRHGNAP